MNTITITVKSVNIVKTGVRQDKEGNDVTWMLLNVVDENDKRYSTFDEGYLKTVGKTITINYEDKPSDKINPKTDKPYMNRNIVDGKKGNKTTQNSTQAWAEKLVAKVKELEVRILKLESFTGADQVVERPSLNEDEIKPEDIPF
jgi:hypothetical protein